DYIELDENGHKYKDEGLPERRALKTLSKGPKNTDELTKEGLAKDELNIVIGALKKKAAIDIEKKDGELHLTITAQGKKLLQEESLEERFLKGDFPKKAKELKPEEKFAADNLKKRKRIIKQDTKKTITATPTAKGKKLIEQGISQEAGIDRLTPAMLKAGSWKKKKFRPYDLEAAVPHKHKGRQHFVNEAIRYVKSIWLEMGFQEMTGTHVQTAFWDLDALFVPQDHPAREMQDTYYLKDPTKGDVKDERAWKRVKSVHEDGGDTGSTGWKTPFNPSLSLKNLLRTHTTVLSAKKLAGIKKEDLPAKYFSVGKVYRNEALDWKHLFEFHQVDGIVIDPDANLKHLKGYLEAFYKKMGFPHVRMRPAHFPYTEPSIEVEAWHPEKKEWVEMGGAGIFRPEVTKTLIGEEIPVLAWGLGLERIIAPYYDITDIRKLYDNDLKQLRGMKHDTR
ncbi:phenylalanine--tRNA ligase subunit alpha, partial [Candidatus Woesearchaeota archaeon]|nr:phenylalanine--tRNA ligase subunit alpha [Candidatus Woesearchaeota archaeon]